MKRPPLFSFFAAILCFPALMAQGVLIEPQGLQASDGEFADTVVSRGKSCAGRIATASSATTATTGSPPPGWARPATPSSLTPSPSPKRTGPGTTGWWAERRRERGPFSGMVQGSTATESANYFDEDAREATRPVTRRKRVPWRLRRPRQGRTASVIRSRLFLPAPVAPHSSACGAPSRRRRRGRGDEKDPVVRRERSGSQYGLGERQVEGGHVHREGHRRPREKNRAAQR